MVEWQVRSKVTLFWPENVIFYYPKIVRNCGCKTTCVDCCPDAIVQNNFYLFKKRFKAWYTHSYYFHDFLVHHFNIGAICAIINWISTSVSIRPIRKYVQYFYGNEWFNLNDSSTLKPKKPINASHQMVIRLFLYFPARSWTIRKCRYNPFFNFGQLIHPQRSTFGWKKYFFSRSLEFSSFGWRIQSRILTKKSFLKQSCRTRRRRAKRSSWTNRPIVRLRKVLKSVAPMKEPWASGLILFMDGKSDSWYSRMAHFLTINPKMKRTSAVEGPFLYKKQLSRYSYWCELGSSGFFSAKKRCFLLLYSMLVWLPELD